MTESDQQLYKFVFIAAAIISALITAKCTISALKKFVSDMVVDFVALIAILAAGAVWVYVFNPELIPEFKMYWNEIKEMIQNEFR